jgi:hypothetical protein
MGRCSYRSFGEEMKFYTSYTPKDWEIGIGFYREAISIDETEKIITLMPTEFALFLGPFSICVKF